METKKDVFAVLSAIDCSEHVEQKNGLNYLSWAWAWGLVKKNFPKSNYTIYENADGLNYHTDGKTAWVKTGVTIDGIEHIEMLPVMDNRNRSIILDNITSFDVNKAIQRSLTKAVARHGLGLYIYAGEDLPDAVKEEKAQAAESAEKSIIAEVEGCKTQEELNKLWNSHPELQSQGSAFYNAVLEKNTKFIAAKK